MRKALWIVVGAALLALGLGAARLVDPPAAASPAEAGSFSFRFAWPRGTTYAYDLAWRLAQRTQVGESALQGRLALRGRLELRSYGPAADGAATLLGLRFLSLAEAEASMAGQALLGDGAATRAALVGPEAFLEVEPSGRVRAVLVPRAAPELFGYVAQTLAGDAEVTVPAGGETAWVARAHAAAGEVERRWAAESATALTRRTLRVPAPRLAPQAMLASATAKASGQGRVELAAAGHVVALTADESLVLTGAGGEPLADSDDRIELRLRAIGTFAPGAGPDLATLQRRMPGELVASAETQRRLLEARADGLTVDALLNDLATQAAAGRMLDHSRWLWRAVAVLRLHPEACAELVPLFLDPDTGAKGRALLLDLLAATGHGEAQAAMRAMLASTIAKDDPAYPLLLQRTSVLPAPDGATVALLADVHAQAARAGDDDTRYAAAWALGAAAGKLPDAEAEAVSASLRGELGAATTTAARTAYLGALGNSGRPADLAAIRGHLGDGDPGVQLAAIEATWKRPGEVADELLGRLAGAELGVQRAILEALARAPLADAQLGRLAALVADGTLAREADGALVGLLARQLRPSAAIVAMLEAVIARQADQPALVAQARALLGKLGAGA